MSTHTPGPWTVRPLSGKYYRTVIDLPDGGEIESGGARCGEASAREDATVERWNDHYEDARVFANARLIAAAPDLLDIARTVVSFLRSVEWERAINANESDALETALDAAIAKAEGRS